MVGFSVCAWNIDHLLEKARTLDVVARIVTTSVLDRRAVIFGCPAGVKDLHAIHHNHHRPHYAATTKAEYAFRAN